MSTFKEEAEKSHDYVPVALAAEFRRIVYSFGYASPPQKDEATKLGRLGIVIFYKGNKPRRTYQGFAFVKCDLGSVGDKYAEIAITSVIVSRSRSKPLKLGPKRFGLTSGRFYLI